MDTEMDNIDNSAKPNKKGFFIAFSIFLILLLASSSFIYLKITYPTTSPFIAITYIIEAVRHPHANMTKQTVGFLPYWRMDDIKYTRFDLLSEVVFFSLTADENGNIVKIVGNETDPGWRWWKSQTVKDLIAKTQISGGKFSLAVAMQKNDTLESFLNNQIAQNNLISNLLEIVKENHLDGINLDFEYAGELSEESYRDKFTQFATSFTSEFRSSSPSTELSIDLYPFSIQKPRLFDVNKLVPLFDKIIVMSYDYYGASSEVAGPVAPMGGYSEGKYYFDVNTTYNDYIKVVPKEKIIMGIPYYTWDYPVEEGERPMSKVLPQNDENGYPAIMSYGRMRANTDIKQENCKWDDVAKENWCFYQDALTGKFHQIWIEDNKSIETKFDFAKSNDLGGIAIWTLGYDKSYIDLWEMLEKKFSLPK
jgi:spore germination protein YaaH